MTLLGHTLPGPAWCGCGHHVTVHPLTRLGEHPCLAGGCPCAAFRESPAPLDGGKKDAPGATKGEP